MRPREEYFARVVPLLGEGLRHHRLGARELSLTGRVVELLTSCMLEEIVAPGDDERIGWPLPLTCRGPAVRGGATTALELLRRQLQWRNGFVPLRWSSAKQVDLQLRARLLPPGGAPHVTWDRRQRTVTMHVVQGDLFSYLELCYAVARQARDLLLGRQGWPRPVVYHGDRHWPFAENERETCAPEPEPATPASHIMVIGCGSVGSEATRLLAAPGMRFTLVDDGRISPFNPQRQWYGTEEIGALKVERLRQRLAPLTAAAIPTRMGQDSQAELRQLLDADPPDLVLLATGTHDHGPLAEVLWARGIAHLCACAYPQARFFEVSVVLPAEQTPCLHCFRGHLYRGAESPPPMTDEVARFLYRELDAVERERAYIDLVAEPATQIETARVAEVTARAALQALARTEHRSAWFRRMLAEGTTCLLGGNVVERQRDGGTAYGLSYAGQVVRLGLQDVAGAGDHRICTICGRRLEVAQRIELPLAGDSEIDQGLLG